MKKTTKENSSEWVGAPCIEKSRKRMDFNAETFTPSERGLRLLLRNKKREEQASDVKLTTAKPKSMKKTESIETNNTYIGISPAHVKSDYKMPSISQQEQHHRIGFESPSNQSPPLHGGLGFDTYDTAKKKLLHRNRDLPSTKLGFQMKEKINFPSSNDKIWDSINFELDNVIPSVFKKSVISKLSSSELSQKFDTWLHQFFVDRFGTKQKIEHFKRNPQKNRELENL